MKTTIVIPAYNEEQNIGNVLVELRNHGYHNVVVVDDGSYDNTFEAAKKYAIVIRHHVNRGMGAALQTGTEYALERNAACIVHFDADGQHRAEDIPALVEPVQSGLYDITLGSRYLGSAVQLPWTKRWFIHMPGRIFQNILTGVQLTDVHNGLRAMNEKAARAIIIRQDRMAHNTEIIQQIKRNKLRFTEVPVTIRYTEYGQGILGALTIIKDLLKKFLFD